MSRPQHIKRDLPDVRIAKARLGLEPTSEQVTIR
jgi:hypothetical protein